jgi:hypothetical protein
MAQQPPPGDDLFHVFEGDPNQPGPTIVYTHSIYKQIEMAFSESFAVADLKPTVIKIHGGDLVVDVVPPASATPAPMPDVRRRPGVLEVALFCLPKAIREDSESFIGDLLESSATKAAEGWPWPLLVVTGTVQVLVMLVVGLWRAGVLKAMGILKLLGL